MDLSPLQRMVSELLVVIAGLTGYAVPAQLPTIELVPSQLLQERLCKRPCPVYAFYRPGGRVMIDAALDPIGNAEARSILLHELVHYVQWARHGSGPKSCRDWQNRENEAYLVQFRWLSKQPPAPRRLVRRRPALPAIVCRGASAPTRKTAG